jgi:3-deoxy-D-manno-octulosonate 8-phosphate phosphatase (KDO 8-P phosphatase)
MSKVGLPIAVANAHDLVKKNSAFVTNKSGGNGAVREVCDMLLKSQNNYDTAMERYLS